VRCPRFRTTAEPGRSSSSPGSVRGRTRIQGKPRELVAQDYVYSITRALDPNLKRGGDPAFTDLIVGARQVVDAAKKAGKLDYDAKIEGLAAVDRHTLRLKLTAVDYTVLERLAQLVTFAVAGKRSRRRVPTS
jgi:ABC-type transport system substrate-binding protein